MSLKIIITGNKGYVGTALIEYLNNKYNYKILGIDSNFFKGCNLEILKKNYLQIYKDIRHVTLKDLQDADALVHLCAISNDPMGNKYKKVTEDINIKASENILKLLTKSKIRNIVFASSCSIYGSSGNTSVNESSKIKPLTNYAKSKAIFEKKLRIFSKKNPYFKITSLRFPTACGYSKMLRLDLVLNDFVASAVKENSINLLSAGTSWRPLIDVQDMSRAIDWALHRDFNPSYIAINAGCNKNNFRVIDLAKLVKKTLPIKTKINILDKANIDKRSYKVSFNKFEKIAKKFSPKIKIEKSILEIYQKIKHNKKIIKKFRESNLVRLVKLQKLIDSKKLNKNLLWIK